MNVVKVPVVFLSGEDIEALDDLTATIFQVCEPKNCIECPFYGLITTTCEEFRLSLENIVNAATRNNNTLHGWGDD